MSLVLVSFADHHLMTGMAIEHAIPAPAIAARMQEKTSAFGFAAICSLSQPSMDDETIAGKNTEPSIPAAATPPVLATESNTSPFFSLIYAPIAV